MRYLLDTHLLLWAAAEPDRLPAPARTIIEDAGHELIFSVASIWEISIKAGPGRADFLVDSLGFTAPCSMPVTSNFRYGVSMPQPSRNSRRTTRTRSIGSWSPRPAPKA